MNNKVAEKLRSLRKQKGWSQIEVAELLNISTSAYSRMETGGSCSWASKLEDICKLYDIEAEEFFSAPKTIINNNQQGGVGYAETINQLSEKLMEQMEARLKEKDEMIAALRERLRGFERE